MALLWGYFPSQFLNKKPDQICFSSLIIPSFSVRFVPVRATGTEGGSRVSGQGAYQDPALLRRPLVSPPVPVVGGEDEEAQEGRPPAGGDGEGEGEGEGKWKKKSKRSKAGEWMDWEDQILDDTVPLVGFVRMILHSGKYDSGDRLVPEHEKTILERLLPYHPEFEKKIGCGIDYITVGFHPEFENSRCLFIVRKDGELVDFSYWKCIKGLIKKNYPLYADSFILRHFRRRRQID